MLDYRGEVRTSNNSKAKIFVVNLDPVLELKLNYETIYDSELCTVITESNPTLNLYTFKISLNS